MLILSLVPLLLAVTAQGDPLPVPNVLHIPIRRRSNSYPIDPAGAAKSVRVKYGYESPASTNLHTRQTTSGVSIIDAVRVVHSALLSGANFQRHRRMPILVI
jgi:hypothetical protein